MGYAHLRYIFVYDFDETYREQVIPGRLLRQRNLQSTLLRSRLLKMVKVYDVWNVKITSKEVRSLSFFVPYIIRGRLKRNGDLITRN